MSLRVRPAHAARRVRLDLIPCARQEGTACTGYHHGREFLQDSAVALLPPPRPACIHGRGGALLPFLPSSLVLLLAPPLCLCSEASQAPLTNSGCPSHGEFAQRQQQQPLLRLGLPVTAEVATAGRGGDRSITASEVAVAFGSWPLSHRSLVRSTFRLQFDPASRWSEQYDTEASQMAG